MPKMLLGLIAIFLLWHASLSAAAQTEPRPADTMVLAKIDFYLNKKYDSKAKLRRWTGATEVPASAAEVPVPSDEPVWLMAVFFDTPGKKLHGLFYVTQKSGVINSIISEAK